MIRIFSLVLVFALAWHSSAAAQGIMVTLDEPVQEFPPGLFSDGVRHKVKDYEGKLLVLHFFEASRVRDSFPALGGLVKVYQGKPVKFLAIGNVTLPQAQAIQQQTGLGIPIFADSFNLMQARYGFQIAGNSWQMRVVGSKGKLSGFGPNREPNNGLDKGYIDKLLKSTGAQFKYNPADYDPKLRPALEFLEYGQSAAALKLLAPFAKGGSKTVAEAANKLITEVKTEAEKWKVEAEEAESLDPLKAHDLYQKIALAMPASELGKAAAAAARKLAADKSIVPELAARKAFTALEQTMSQVTVAGRPSILQTCKSIMKKYAGTATADKADDLYRELSGKDATLKSLK